MEAKKLDATVLDSPQTVQARRLGFLVLADGVELGIPFLQGGLVTRRAYIKSNEDTVRRVVRVIVEAIHYAKTNREAALKVMQKYLRVQDRDALEDAYESFVVKQFPGSLMRTRGGPSDFRSRRSTRPARQDRRSAGLHRYALCPRTGAERSYRPDLQPESLQIR
jgi:ABC-type nitrate/sulfonate/bicarbonate transport system substrate-binding protein